MKRKSRSSKAALENVCDQPKSTESPLETLLRKSLEVSPNQAPHLIVKARAGTGKTTTLIEGLKEIKKTALVAEAGKIQDQFLGGRSTRDPVTGLTPTEATKKIKILLDQAGLVGSKMLPSPQQAAVWDAMCQGPAPSSICFVAFNKSIAEELQRRVPAGCDAMTMHSMGFKSINRAFTRPKVSSFRVQDIIAELLEVDIRELRRTKPVVIKATEELVGLCKMNLTFQSELGHADELLSDLAAHYDVDLNSSQAEVFSLVPRVLERCKDVARDNCVDFNDMIWLPVVLNLPVTKYDLLLVDEAQDLNRCQQALAKRAGKRLVLCGDPKQAIYGFAGADADSMPRMARELAGNKCITLPLTVTRRCGKAIVAEAKKIVPDFDAFETNPEGRVGAARYDRKNCVPTYHDLVQDSDMVLCRVNAPLVSQCFKFLKMSRKANIQGRDVGKGLITTINKMKANDVKDLTGKLSDWCDAEVAKEQAKKNPSEQRVIAVQDRYDCLCCFCEDQTSVAAVIAKIEAIFTDDKGTAGIRLSSIHKAKGLEAKRVFFLQPKGAECPHPMAKTPWQREQEMNLKYVAITRAIEELVFVS